MNDDDHPPIAVAFPARPLTAREERGSAVERNPPTVEVYDALWRAYRDGVRQKKTLARAVGVSPKLARAAIERGWPSQEWASLRSRLEMWDRQRSAALATADREAAEKAGATTAAAWLEYRQRALNVSSELQQSIGALGAKVKQAAAAATFVRYRKVRSVIKDASGKDQVMITDQAYVDATAVAKATALLTAAVRENSSAVAFLVGAEGRAAADAAPEITPEQIAQLERGEMPADLNVQMLGRALLAGKLTPVLAGEKE